QTPVGVSHNVNALSCGQNQAIQPTLKVEPKSTPVRPEPDPAVVVVLKRSVRPGQGSLKATLPYDGAAVGLRNLPSVPCLHQASIVRKLPTLAQCIAARIQTVVMAY